MHNSYLILRSVKKNSWCRPIIKKALLRWIVSLIYIFRYKYRCFLNIFKPKVYYQGIVSVQFSRSVTSNSLWPHGLHHARLPCPSQLLEFTQIHVQWVGDAIQPSHPVIPFSSCPQSFPVSQLFAWGGQSIGVSASASVLPMNILD